MGKKLLFNFSGHPLPHEVKDAIVEDYEIPTTDLSKLNTALEATTNLLKIPYEKHKEEILKGDYEIILPGASILTTLFITVLHGLSGHFPRIRYIYKASDGKFKVSDPIDLQNIRIQARDSRFFESLK